MNKIKINSAKTLNYIVVVALFVIGIFSGILSWMFSVSAAATTAAFDPSVVTVTQLESLQLLSRISDNLTWCALWFIVLSMVFAVIFSIKIKANDTVWYKVVGMLIIGSMLIVSLVLRESIVNRLIVVSA